MPESYYYCKVNACTHLWPRSLLCLNLTDGRHDDPGRQSVNIQAGVSRRKDHHRLPSAQQLLGGLQRSVAIHGPCLHGWLQQLVLPDTALTAAQPGPVFSSRFVARNRYEFVAEFRNGWTISSSEIF